VRRSVPEVRNEGNYRISDADKIGEGPPRQKYRQNVAAIHTLRTLEAENRPATPDEKAILVRYVGWGAMPQVFDPRNYEWREARAEVEQLLTPDELEAARASTLNAHYTSPTVVRAMYGALERFGFEYGRILEPACGIGHFIGLMPEAMHRHSTVTGVEIDPLTARIARALYPDADVRAQGFENAQLADGFYDVAISNVPFGDYPVHDPHLNAYRFPIHDYFFAKAIEKVRPGGLVMFVTSRGTMDKVNSTLREYLAPKAEFLGAVRLPNTAFKQNAGTEVTTDIVMLRKLYPGEAPRGPAWREVRDFTNHTQETIPINEYFVERPHMMLGHLQLSGRMYRDNEPTLEGGGRVLGDALATAIPELPAGIYRVQRVELAESTTEQTIPAPDFVKPNAYCIHDGIVCIREENVLRQLTDLPGETRSRIRGLIQVRDAVRSCLRSQLDGSGEEQVTEARR
jgi:SAM-dependent methyltransferase